MGDVVHNMSAGVGGTVHQVTAGMKRLLTAPPDTPTTDAYRRTLEEGEDEEEGPGVLPATPRNTSLSPTPPDLPHTDQ